MLFGIASTITIHPTPVRVIYPPAIHLDAFSNQVQDMVLIMEAKSVREMRSSRSGLLARICCRGDGNGLEGDGQDGNGQDGNGQDGNGQDGNGQVNNDV